MCSNSGGLCTDVWALIVKIMNIKDVKVLRLVSKALSRIGIEVLFQTVNLFESSISLQRLCSMVPCSSTAHAISKTTKELRLFTLHSFKPETDRVEGILPIPHSDFSQVRREKIDVKSFEKALGHFRNLNTLIVRDFAWVSKYESDMEMIGGQLVKRVLAGKYFSLSYNSRALACAAIAIQKHNLSPQYLQVDMGFNLLIDEEVLSAIKYAFGQARFLDVAMELRDTTCPWDEHEKVCELAEMQAVDQIQLHVFSQGLLPQCFAEALKLETLKVVFNCWFKRSWQSRSIESYLGSKTWPHLRALNLAKLIIDAKSLLRVLHRNGNTLEELYLGKPIFTGDQWPMFFRSLRDYHHEGKMHLEVLDITGAMQWTYLASDDYELESMNPVHPWYVITSANEHFI